MEIEGKHKRLLETPALGPSAVAGPDVEDQYLPLYFSCDLGLERGAIGCGG